MCLERSKNFLDHLPILVLLIQFSTLCDVHKVSKIVEGKLRDASDDTEKFSVTQFVFEEKILLLCETLFAGRNQSLSRVVLI